MRDDRAEKRGRRLLLDGAFSETRAACAAAGGSVCVHVGARLGLSNSIKPRTPCTRMASQPPGLCDCCAQPGGCQLCCQSCWCPCVTFGQIMQGMPENKDKNNACLQYGSAYFVLGYVLPACVSGACGAAALAAGANSASSLLSCGAQIWAGHVNGQVLGPQNSTEFCAIAKGVFCLPCALCQAKNYQDEVAPAAKVGRGTTLRAPKVLKM